MDFKKERILRDINIINKRIQDRDTQKKFKPDYTPYQIMKEGSFLDQGGYWRPIYSSLLKKTIQDDYKKYDWVDLELDKLICISNPSRNKYGVKSGSSLLEWERNGWIIPEFDPRGWYEWYVNYYSGRRIPDYDTWQIKRWLNVKSRFSALKKTPRVKQTLLQWGISS